ncbi:hypothetical protein E2C01_098224 [Portunus trituberculatus]|uniref:Uncharacterized protein n=1 Tax=Portunus trituberculatus TaxID=210409 RepID=A0A5B7KCD6_PORTR|nr:hypothetical protein [Portunus trituberculatus]
MEQKYVPQKNSQNRRLLREALVEGNPPSNLALKMTTSRGPGQPPHENLDYNGRERWLPWKGYLVPMRTSRFKKKSALSFVNDRAETPPPKASYPGHPTIQHRTASIGRSLQVSPLVHWQPT